MKTSKLKSHCIASVFFLNIFYGKILFLKIQNGGIMKFFFQKIQGFTIAPYNCCVKRGVASAIYSLCTSNFYLQPPHGVHRYLLVLEEVNGNQPTGRSQILATNEGEGKSNV
jgi:hypothetical protein